MKQLRDAFVQFVFETVFPKHHRLLKQLVQDNQELIGICLEKSEQTKKLENQIAQLEYDLEDEEIKNEQLQIQLQRAMDRLGELMDK